MPRTILLAHGLLGFSQIGPVHYFDGVKQCFAPGCTFLTPAVAPAGSIENRAEQLDRAIPPELRHPGAGIHIVGHSMGGLDARYLMSANGLGRASWIASLTTISTPHWGSPLADLITGERTLQLSHLEGLTQLPADIVVSVLKSINNPGTLHIPLLAPKALFDALKDIETYLADIFGTPPEAFHDLTTSSTKAFNRAHPILQDVPSLCYVGDSNPSLTMCRDLYATWAYLKAVGGDNDGVVPTSSSTWGTLVRTIPADHLEEVGLAGYFDGLPPINHYGVCNIYRDIDTWQQVLDTWQQVLDA